jgi:peroxiredoxin
LQGFVEAQAQFDSLNTQVLAFSVDPWPAANAFGESVSATFPVLGDWPLYTVSRAFGVYNEERHVTSRVTFVLDENRVVRAVIDEPRDMEKHSQDALAAVRALS